MSAESHIVRLAVSAAALLVFAAAAPAATTPGSPPPPVPKPLSPPVCDYFSDLAPACTLSELQSGDATRSAATSYATCESGEDSICHSVWYHFTLAGGGRITANTCNGTTFDTILGIYRGADLGSLTQIAANDDACGVQSEVSFNVDPGVRYHVRVDGQGGVTGFFRLVLVVWPGPRQRLLAPDFRSASRPD
jgi:hypothetical protein